MEESIQEQYEFLYEIYKLENKYGKTEETNTFSEELENEK